MRDFLLFLIVLAAVVFCLFMLYTCCHFWIKTRNSPTVNVYPADEERRREPALVRETFVSVFYSSNEVTTVNSQNRNDTLTSSANNNGTAQSAIAGSSSEEQQQQQPEEPIKKAEQRKGIMTKTIESVQAEHKSKPWNSEKLGCDVVIGVHANEERIAGYCLDVKNKTCDFYSYDISRLPWTLKENKRIAVAGASKKNNNTRRLNVRTEVDKKWMNECQSKNLMFALLLWEDKLKEMKKFKLYTDDDTSRWPTNEYGKRVRALLCHMEDCENLYKANTMIVINDEKSDKYIRYVYPAVELSRMRLPCFADYISGAYGVERFEGTHEYVGDEEETGVAGEKKAMYLTTKYFETYLMRVKRRVLNWKLNSCYHCGFCIATSPSLQSLEIKAKNGQSKGISTAFKRSKCSTKNSSLNRKCQKSPFSALKWTKKDAHEEDGDREYSKKQNMAFDPTPTAPLDSDDDSLSGYSKATSGDYSTSKSTYSSKATLPCR